MLQVLVSSTFSDLRTERDTVRKQIEALSGTRGIEWIGMEAFGSLASTPLEASTGHVAQADLIILLIGGRYGSVPPDEEKSFTQQEFEASLAARIPCLAYFAPAAAETSDPALLAFQELVRREVTCDTFGSSDDLAQRVVKDLERELTGIIDVETSDLLTKQPVRVSEFVNRRAELSCLHERLARRTARIAIVGGPGMGKTALMSQYLHEPRARRQEILWLQMDALLGRHADGRKILGARRVGYDSLRRMIADRVKARRHILLIVDNAQADPRGTCWLANQFSEVAICCLTWDQSAVPYGCELAELPSLHQAPALELLRSYCSQEQAYDQAALRDLTLRLDGYPLALDLAGRRLRQNKGLRVRDLLATLQESGAFLGLEGPTLDKETVNIRQLVKGTYHCLNTAERTVLSALAAVPSNAYSDQTVGYLLSVLAPGTAGLDRCIELGMIDRRLHPDWRGHRYSMRSGIREFLQVSDSFIEGKTVAQAYLQSAEVSGDTSVDVVSGALDAQLAHGQVLAEDRWPRLRTLLLDAPQPMRAAVKSRLSSLAGGPQQGALEENIAISLSKPHREKLTIELLELLCLLKPKTSAALRTARNLWIRPKASGGLFPGVQLAAGRALASGEELEFTEWLAVEASSGDPARVERALDAAGLAFLPDMLLYCQRALQVPVRTLRLIGARAFGKFASGGYYEHREFELDPKMRDSLWGVVRDESDDELRSAAAFSLAMWGDERCLAFGKTSSGHAIGPSETTVSLQFTSS